MYKILVAVETSQPGVSAAVYALNLAQRIQAQISFLLFDQTEGDGSSAVSKKKKRLLYQQQLQSIIVEMSPKTETPVNFYVTNGQYETELVDFVLHNNISLLIVDFPTANHQADTNQFLEKLMSIKQQINCRIMIVSKKAFGKNLILNHKRGVS